jgi:hypothetical protein
MPAATGDERRMPWSIPYDGVPSWRGSEILPGLFMGGTADEDVIHVARRREVGFGERGPYDAVVTL